MKSTAISGLFAEGRSEPNVSRLTRREGVAPGEGAGAAPGRAAGAMSEARYRYALPQLGDAIFLTDGGIETTLIFQDGFELPHFAAFDLLASERGRRGLRAYYERYAAMARSNRLGLVLESPTWRASIDWAARLGYDRARLADANRQAIDADGRGARRLRDAGGADGHQRQYRAARRRLRPRTPDERRAGRGLPCRAGGDLRRHRGRHGRRGHHDQCRGSGGRDARRCRRQDARGHLLHGGDRRPPADRPVACRRRHDGRPRNRCGPGLLHDQLRPPDAFRGRSSTATRPGRAGCAACAPTPRRRATPSSTRPPSSTPAIRWSSAASTARCARR